jgi:hypothetical protein
MIRIQSQRDLFLQAAEIWAPPAGTRTPPGLHHLKSWLSGLGVTTLRELKQSQWTRAEAYFGRMRDVCGIIKEGDLF